ncbi:MAG: cell division protein FtsQ/DivIB [Flavobacteriales bacterium]
MKNIKYASVWLLTIGVCAVLFGFSRKEQSEASCWKLNVDVEEIEGVYFINDQTVKTRILNLGQPIIGTPMSEIDVNGIQSDLRAMPSVNNATVYPGIDGVLSIRISQRKPIARIIAKNGVSYYLDEKAQMMPLSEKYTARVPVIVLQRELPFKENKDQSEAALTLLKDMHLLITNIEKDPFWSAQIEHIALLPNGDYELIPRVGIHNILLGSTNKMDRKLKKLKAFYDASINQRNLNQYKRINLKYANQVIGERYY